MAILKIVFCGLVLVTQLTCPLLIMAATAILPAAAAETPKITLQGANGENHCTLDFKNGTYVFKSNKHCRNDRAIGIELEHVPSASNIWLYDDYPCDVNDSGNYFWISLRIIKNDFSTDRPIDLDLIAKTPKGAVIEGAPGVQLIDRYQLNGASMNKRTSCVRIELDAPPPPSP